MSSPSLHILCVAIAATTLCFCAMPAVADYSRVTFTATVLGVETDDPGGTFSGTPVGTAFTGEFRYGISAADATSVSVDTYDTEFFFTGSNYGASFTVGSTSLANDSAWTFIEESAPVPAEDAAFINQAFNLNIQPGTLIDSWGLTAESPDEIWDDAQDCLVNGQVIEIVLADTDATIFDDRSFRAQPPAPADIELAAFFFEEAVGTTGCNTVYAAYGTISNIQYELVVDPGPQPRSKAMPWMPILLEEQDP